MTQRFLLVTPCLIAAIVTFAANAGDLRLPENAAPRGTTAPSDSSEVDESSVTLHLAGRWLLTLPAGYQHRITLERLDDGRYRIPGSLAMAGVYERRGDQLLMDEPVDKRLTVFTWKIDNANSLTLVDETGKTGARYAGATLGRQVDWEGELARSVPLPVHPAARAAARIAAAAGNDPLDRLIGRTIELRGTAYNDAEYGPYLEGSNFVIFIEGLDAWPDDVVETEIVVKGTLRADQLTDDGEQLRIHVLAVDEFRPADDE